jgi:phosphohistidine swiveling domain-containing protein
LGVPVPAGFTLSTSVARAYAQHGVLPKRVQSQVDQELADIEQATGRKFANSQNPLLVSVRSGAAVSMPGMMDTVLNLGMNPEIVSGMAAKYGKRFAYDCYRRFIQMFGQVVLGLPREGFEQILNEVKMDCHITQDSEFDDRGLELLVVRYRKFIEFVGRNTDKPMLAVLDDPRAQLEAAIVAVLRSWNSPRAKEYRRVHRISDDLGTAVNVQAMVYGNHDENSATGVVFSCDVNTGKRGIWGEYLVNAQGEDVVAGIRTPMPIAAMREWNATLFAELSACVQDLDVHFGYVVDVEFTIESGKLYILQVRKAKPSAEAAMTIAVRSVWEKKVTKEAALSMVSDAQLQLMENVGSFEPAAIEEAKAKGRVLGTGIAVSPGAVIGRVALSTEAAVALAAAGEKVILVRPDTSPDDLPGMLAASAIVTMTGGATSHAAVVARALGKPAVTNCSGIGIDCLLSSEIISVDGTNGVVYSGTVALAKTVQDKKEVSLFKKWAKQAQGAEPRLVFEMFEQSVNLDQLIFDFYLVDHMAREAKGTALAGEAKHLKTQVHVETAERIAMYLVSAVCGEVRHAYLRANWDPNTEAVLEGKRALDVLKAEFAIQIDGDDRAESQKVIVETLKTMPQEKHVHFLRLVAAVFNAPVWKGSHGGKKWGNIAQTALAFLTKQLDHSVFADHAFDLEHNGGMVFGKNRMLLTYDRSHSSHLLDLKKGAKSAREMFDTFTGTRVQLQCSPKIGELYVKGKERRIWV